MAISIEKTKTVQKVMERQSFISLSRDFIKKHHNSESSWQKVRFKDVMDEIQEFKNEKGFELIAGRLGIAPLTRENWS